MGFAVRRHEDTIAQARLPHSVFVHQHDFGLRVWAIGRLLSWRSASRRAADANRRLPLREVASERAGVYSIKHFRIISGDDCRAAAHDVSQDDRYVMMGL